MAPRLSQGSLLYMNLALGLFVMVANGAALLLVILGRAERLGNQAVEIAAWTLGGLVLAISAVYALTRGDRIPSVLRFQTYLVLALVLALAAWALMLASGVTSPSAPVAWSVGYLSIIALYCSVLGTHAFPESRYNLHRQMLFWVLVPASVVIDVFTYMKVTS